MEQNNGDKVQSAPTTPLPQELVEGAAALPLNDIVIAGVPSSSEGGGVPVTDAPINTNNELESTGAILKIKNPLNDNNKLEEKEKVRDRSRSASLSRMGKFLGLRSLSRERQKADKKNDIKQIQMVRTNSLGDYPPPPTEGNDGADNTYDDERILDNGLADITRQLNNLTLKMDKFENSSQKILPLNADKHLVNNGVAFSIPENLEPNGQLQTSQVKNFLSIIKTTFKFSKPDTTRVLEFLEMINRLIGDSPLSYRSYNAIVWGSLNEQSRLKIRTINLSSHPRDVIQRIVSKLGDVQSSSSRAAEFYTLQPKANTRLIDFFDLVESYGLKANMSKEVIWKKFFSCLPPSLDTYLTHRLREILSINNVFPTDIHEFLAGALGESLDRYVLKAPSNVGSEIATKNKFKRNFVNNVTASQPAPTVTRNNIPKKNDNKSGTKQGDKKLCSHCNKGYHKVQDCYKKKYANVVCSKCGLTGHISRYCRATNCRLCGATSHNSAECSAYKFDINDKKLTTKKCTVCANTLGKTLYHNEVDCKTRKSMMSNNSGN